MSEAPVALVLDLLEWLAAAPRPYSQAMDAWRTSCPKLPVWEDANDQHFVTETREPGQEPLVHITRTGRQFLEAHRTSTNNMKDVKDMKKSKIASTPS
jgi:hypothetical protein